MSLNSVNFVCDRIVSGQDFFGAVSTTIPMRDALFQKEGSGTTMTIPCSSMDAPILPAQINSTKAPITIVKDRTTTTAFQKRMDGQLMLLPNRISRMDGRLMLLWRNRVLMMGGLLMLP